VGDVVYRQTWLASPPRQEIHCELNGLHCGWDPNENAYGCVAAATEDPKGQAPLSCLTPMPLAFCPLACDADKDCSGGLVCDTEKHQCVACNTTADCPANSVCFANECQTKCQSNQECPVVCNTKAGACAECAEKSDCHDGKSCDQTSGACVECLSDLDCPDVVLGIPPNCHPWHSGCGTGKKVARRCNVLQRCEAKCTSTDDCPQDTVCDPFRLTCVTCIQDKDCKDNASGHVCNLVANRCDECRVNSDCAPSGQICRDTFCYPGCTSDAQCAGTPGQPYCNLDTNQCGSCRDDKDCKDSAFPHCFDKYDCVECRDDADCPGGTCFAGTCYPACSSDQDCKDPSKPVCELKDCVECRVDADCSKGGVVKHCDTSHTCQACVSDFDCPENQACTLVNGEVACAPFAVIDPGYVDVAGDADDVRAGATVLAPLAGEAVSIPSSFCSFEGEIDWFTFQAQAGDTWLFQLAWSWPVEVQIDAFDATGHLLGQSLWQSTQQIELSYLPAGKYFLRATARTSNHFCSDYSLVASRTAGACADDDACGVSFQNQVFRSLCRPDGACVARQAPGNVPEGGRCDQSSDCATGLSCPSENTLYASSSPQRFRCARPCSTDAECVGGQVCESGGRCVLPCASDQDCGVAPDVTPEDGQPWKYYTCTGGHC
jgi:hypothetical protein